MSLNRRQLELAILWCGFTSAIGSGLYAYHTSGPYGTPSRDDPRVKRVVDPATGRLRLLIYDSDGNGRFDTWSDMDGDRLLRIGTDTDGDGRIDRWEYFAPDGTLEAIGSSSSHDGRLETLREATRTTDANRTDAK